MLWFVCPSAEVIKRAFIAYSFFPSFFVFVFVFYTPAVHTAPTRSFSITLSLPAYTMRAATLLLALTAVLPSAFATVYVSFFLPSVSCYSQSANPNGTQTTSPTATTSWQGGKPQRIEWINDPNNPTPALSDFGPCKISIYVGNAQQQTSLQLLSPSTDVSKNNSLEFTPDPTIGPNSNQ